MKLYGYNYKVEYKKGSENRAADGLSRKEEVQLQAVTVVQSDWLHYYKEAMRSSPYYQEQLQKWEQGLLDASKYSLKRELLYYKNRLLIDPTSEFTSVMFKEHHSTPQSGHSGFQKTLHRLRRVCY